MRRIAFKGEANEKDLLCPCRMQEGGVLAKRAPSADSSYDMDYEQDTQAIRICHSFLSQRKSFVSASSPPFLFNPQVPLANTNALTILSFRPGTKGI